MVNLYLEKYGPRSCEYNFANLFCWQDAYQYSWRLFKGRLVVYDGLSQSAFMPLGEELSTEELVELSRYLVGNGLGPNIGVVTREYVENHPELEVYYGISSQRDYAEYIYSTRALAQLKGNKLHKKRNLISQFKRRYPDYRILPMTEENKKHARALAYGLAKRRSPLSRDLQNEMAALTRAFDSFSCLNLGGILIMVQDQVVAFSIFSPLRGTPIYDIQFEKADLNFKGAGQMINWATADYLADKCEFVNREQDLGILGLRQAKMSYDPHELLSIYSLEFRDKKLS